MAILERIASCGVVPVIVLDDAAQAAPTAKALLAGGIGVMEITFRTAAAKESIAAVVREAPDMLVGAGTVVTLAQLEAALEAGARFIVSPGSDAALIAACVEKGVPIFPGAVTPSELMLGLARGLTVFKFFPAENYGGLKTIKALSGPFPQARFIPTGGVSEQNAAEYLASDRILAVGGSWMAPAELIASGNYEEITRRSARAAALVRTSRSEG